ncbi:DUF4349 domain-containing protein [Streptomyces sp. CRN 30]|uniref:DUF4349 domain-containing protein n=1 Tax=Streptomyces sp. CRN 30 TaxID=3075613 RepID=UPI002A828918|nr:DUF4349 domain-containing protein [Streptomyces sp. CRN 30]
MAPGTTGTTRAPRSGPAVRLVAAGLLAAALALTGCGASDSGGGSEAADAPAVQRAEPGTGAEAAEAGAGSGADESTGDEDNGDESGSDGSSGDKAAEAPGLTAQSVIRTASLTVRVKDVPEALAAARAATEDAGGFVGEETTGRDAEGSGHTRVVLRVPTDAYQEVLASLEGTGELVERGAKAQDVTDQVVDVESRITSQRASVARIRELMDRATGLTDVVTLEGELSSRQADLEALLARQASLKDRTGLATITLHLSDAAADREGGDGEDGQPGLVDALTGGWDAFVAVLRWCVIVLGAVLPFAASLALLLFLWLRLVRPRLPHRPATDGRRDPRGPAGPPAP